MLGRWAVWLVVAVVAGSGRTAWPQAGVKPLAGIGAPIPDAPAVPTGPEGPKPLAIPQIASEAEGAVSRLRAFEVGASSLESVGAIERRLPQLEQRVSEATEQTYRILSESPTLSALDGLLDPWQGVDEQAESWVDMLTRRAEFLERTLASVDGISVQWQVTQEAAVAAGAPEATAARIQDTLRVAEDVRTRVAARRAVVLGLQDRVARIQARAGQMLELVQADRRERLGHFFARDGVPLWEFFTRADAWHRVQGQAGQSLGGELALVRIFLEEHGHDLLVAVALFFGLAFGLRWMGQRAARWTALDPDLGWRFRPFAHPWASASLLTLVVMLATRPVEPRIMQLVAVTAAVVPIVRLIADLVTPALVPAVWVVGLFHVVDLLREMISSVPLLEQAVLQLQLLTLVAAAVWLHRSPIDGVPEALRARWQRGTLVVVVLATTASMAAILGYMRLARLIEFFVITVAYSGLLLFALVRISDAMLGVALRVRPLRLLRAVQEHRTGLEAWLQHAVRLAAVALWGLSLARWLSLADPIGVRLGAVFGTPVGWGVVSVSLGDLLAFGIVVWLAFQLSRALRALLEDDVFSRVEVGRGVASALSSLAHYLILLLGFLIGLGVLGIDLTRITIIAGALGVGIGFGLQNVVNNFVSGLILLFERPVQVGDSVQLGTLTGEVRRIGIRSSTVRTFDGAEVIVPNSNLVSDQVTNWTLSDRMRRIDLDVGVGYESDPEQVIALINDVARANSGVLPDPAPLVLFVGFGDSALNFQVRVWTARYEDWLNTRSSLGLGILAALRAAGIVIPYPQRDMHLVGDPAGGGRSTPPVKEGPPS